MARGWLHGERKLAMPQYGFAALLFLCFDLATMSSFVEGGVTYMCVLRALAVALCHVVSQHRRGWSPNFGPPHQMG